MENLAKFYSIPVLFVMSFIFGFVLPLCAIRILQRKYSDSINILNNIVSVLHCFSGGVFFATSILDLLPEAREQMEKAGITIEDDEDYPATELILGVGFLFILILENVTITCHKNRIHSNDNKYEFSTRESLQNGGGPPMTVTTVTSVPTISKEIKVETGASNISSESRTEGAYTEGEPIGKSSSFIRNMTMLMAISIHMIFDGLELGLLETDTQVWTLLLALSIHKTLILFSMGLKICESTSLCKFAIAMVYLSLISPIGVGIGIALSSQDENITVLRASAFLQSFAVGNFIYIAFFELLFMEFLSNDQKRMLKTIAIVIGFSLYAIINFFLPG